MFWFLGEGRQGVPILSPGCSSYVELKQVLNGLFYTKNGGKLNYNLLVSLILCSTNIGTSQAIYKLTF